MVYGTISLRKREGVSRKKWQKDTGEGGTVIKVMLLKVQFFWEWRAFWITPMQNCLMLEVHNEDTWTICDNGYQQHMQKVYNTTIKSIASSLLTYCWLAKHNYTEGKNKIKSSK